MLHRDESNGKIYAMKVEALNCPSCGTPLGKNLKPGKRMVCPACDSALIVSDWTVEGEIACRKCGRVCDGAHRYCLGCGALLRAGCPFCYTLNQVSAKRCRTCGANLQQAWDRQREWLAGRRSFDEQRKAVWEKADATDRAARLNRLLLQLDDPQNHPMAIFCLQQIGSEAVKGLIEQLDNDDPDARYGAAHALGMIGDRRAIPALLQSLEDPEASVRYWAAEALGRLRAEEAITALIEMLRDPSRGVREAAMEALRKITKAKAAQSMK